MRTFWPGGTGVWPKSMVESSVPNIVIKRHPIQPRSFFATLNYRRLLSHSVQGRSVLYTLPDPLQISHINARPSKTTSTPTISFLEN